MTGTALLTIGVDYDQHLKNIEAIFERALERALGKLSTPDNASTAEVGGIELAQEVTRLSKSRIYNLVSERSLPHSKRGNKLYFSRAKLQAWVDAGKREVYND